MLGLYSFFVAFLLVFFSELGDKTQLIVLSFSTKLKASTILLGVALGSFFSHGIAILFGSFLGNLENNNIHFILEFITYSSFILLGLLSFIPSKSKEDNDNGLVNKFSNFKLNYVFIIAMAIAFGEIGDKTFLASIGLGINYPQDKIMLVLGAILGMIASDLIAIFTGKFLSKKIPEKAITIFSGILFIVFGIIGFFSL